jgi:NTE family protein
MKTKIAIACQGGGSYAAFTAGALQALFDNGVQDRFNIMSLSGTSGGALCAALVWYSLKKGENPVERLANFWNDNSAQSYQERLFNDFSIKNIELINKGVLPQIKVSPASSSLHRWLSLTTAAWGLRTRFTNLQELIEAHIDFQEIATWGAQPEPPILLMGAINILTGKLSRFDSAHESIKVENVLASCAAPTLFPAVEIGDNAYWDGIFADNPPLVALTDPNFIASYANVPEEIWVIKLNSTDRSSIPFYTDDILERRSELEGNVALFQSLRTIERINDFLVEGAFTNEFLEKYHIKEPIKIPKPFGEKEDKSYHIPFIEISADLQESLNYESKLDRNPDLINQLIEDGKQQAKEFLEARSGVIPSPT